ncbi:MAG: hypothetical protein ACI92B_002347, partial [Marinobacter maritimus]
DAAVKRIGTYLQRVLRTLAHRWPAPKSEGYRLESFDAEH